MGGARVGQGYAQRDHRRPLGPGRSAGPRGADLLFDVQVTGWGFAYRPSPTHYFVLLGVKLRVIDVPNKALIAEGFCSRNDKDAKDLPTYDQLLAEHGALLKSKLKADTDACIEEFKQRVLNIPASAT